MAARVIGKIAKTFLKTPSQAVRTRNCSGLPPAVSYAQTLQNLPETSVTTLENGLRVASEDTGTPYCTVGLWIDCGSRYEEEENNGVNHFLEHLAFKGTAKRAQKDLEKEITALGAQLNAYTSREQTAYFAKCLKKDVPKMVEILSDIIQNSKFGESEIERERKVILQELQEMQYDVKPAVFDHLHSVAYQGTPLGKSIYGTTENVRSINAAQLAEFITNQYKGPRVVLAGAGGIKHDDLLKAAQQHLSSVKYTYEGEIPLMTPCRYTGSDVRVRDDSMPLAYIALGVEGCGKNDPDYLPLEVAKNIVGSWDRTYPGLNNVSSKLAKNAVDYKLCHGFQSFNISYSDTGLWGTYYVCHKMIIDDMTFALQEEWMRICNSVTEGDVTRGKNLLRTQLLQNSSTTTGLCEEIASQLLWNGRRIPFHELEAMIDVIDAKTVRDVATKYIYDRCPVVAGVGPVEQLTDYLRIRGAMYWLRV